MRGIRPTGEYDGDLPVDRLAPVAIQSSSSRRSARMEGVPVWALMALPVATAAVALSAYMNVDPDVFWHRVLGQEWLRQGNVGLAVDPIAYTSGKSWFPTSWSVEVLYASLVDRFGYAGITWLRFGLAVAFLLLVGRALFAVARPPAACAVFTIVALPAALVVQDRPQTFSLVFVAAILPAISRALTADVTPPLWRILAVAWVWANVHGLWFLIPALLCLLALVRIGERDRGWREAALAAALGLAVGALTPVGPKLLSSPLLVQRSAGAVREWEATALLSPVAWGLGGCVLILLVSWSRGHRVAPREVAFVVTMTVFGLIAFRNAVFASLLLAPVAAAALDRGFPALSSGLVVSRRWAAAIAPLFVLLAVMTYARHADVTDQRPVELAAALRDQDRPLHVVASYDLGGFLRDFGGPDVKVAVDGRVDRYSPGFVESYFDMLDVRPGWRRDFAHLRPDAVVLERGSPLRNALTQSGWAEISRDGDYVLLLPTPVT